MLTYSGFTGSEKCQWNFCHDSEMSDICVMSCEVVYCVHGFCLWFIVGFLDLGSMDSGPESVVWVIM